MQQSVLTTEPDQISLVEKIASRDPLEQIQARKALESGDPACFEALLQILERENRKKPRRFGIAMTAMIVCTFAIQLLCDVVLHKHVGGMFGSMWMLWVGAAAAFAPTRLQREAARKVADSDDIRAVGPLAESLDRQDSATKKAAAKAMTRLLPRLKHSDAQLLSERQMKCLLSGFGTIKDREFKLAVLKSLAQIGDERFLKSVASLAEGKGSAKKDAEIRECALETLPALKERIDEDKTRLSLLHPVESPGSDALLRPARSANSDETSLLRPAHTAAPDCKP